MVNNPSLYSKTVPFGHATVADSVGNIFQPGYLPQQAPLGTSQYSANPMYPPRQIMSVQRYGTGLSQDTIVKIDELKRLMNKHPKYHTNSNGIIQWAIHTSINADNRFLDDKLEQLRTIDSLANIKF
jgi:hypothetical protein